VPVVAFTDVTPETFYARFVATRTPCILTGLPPDGDWSSAVWSLPALRATAGHCTVSGERRGPGKAGAGAGTGAGAGATSAPRAQAFGFGLRENMPFSAVIDEIAGGGEALYLSAQELAPLEGPAAPHLPLPMHPLPPPMHLLTAHFPLRIGLLPHLVPQQVNM
jgi:hypothetical protein